MNPPEIDEDVMIRNAYVLGAILMRDNVCDAFARGRSMIEIRKMYPPEPDVQHLRDMELERLKATERS